MFRYDLVVDAHHINFQFVFSYFRLIMPNEKKKFQVSAWPMYTWILLLLLLCVDTFYLFPVGNV